MRLGWEKDGSSRLTLHLQICWDPLSMAIAAMVNANVSQHTVCRHAQRTVDREPAGTFVSSTTEDLRYSRHIDRSFAAQTHPETLIRKLTEKRRHLDAGDSHRVIYKSFQVLFDPATAFHIMLRYIHPRQLAFAMQVIQRISQQTHLRCRTAEVYALRNPHWIGAESHKLLRQLEGTIIGSGIAERTCIRE